MHACAASRPLHRSLTNRTHRRRPLCARAAMYGDAHKRRALIVDILNRVAYSLVIIG